MTRRAANEMSVEDYNQLMRIGLRPVGEDAPPKRGNKLHARPTVVDNIRFASLGEARRYGQLKLLQAAGEITDLKLQVAYPLTVNGETVARYIADFVYVEVASGQQVVEDYKGMRTPIYKLKARLMKAVHGITILETDDGRPRRKRR